MRPSYLYNGDPYTVDTASFYLVAFKCPILLPWITFNPSMDNWSHAQ